MPRQKIDSAGTDPTQVEVGWGDGRVQVGVSGVSIVVDGEQHTSLWSNLDRRGCNTLIQTVRRARDAAFGQDA